MQISKACIIGAGTMGTGIAQVAAQAGISVCLIDTTDEALERSRKVLESSLRAGIEREKITVEQADEIRGRVQWLTTRDAVGEADWIVEAVFEDPQEKGRILREVSAEARPEAIIASNTSTIPISRLAESCEHPGRFLGMHFFNPAPAMKLVEVIAGENTAPETTLAATRLCERLGKTPLMAPDIPGFLVNRAFGSLVAAAVDIWLQGAEPEAIDASLELGLGHKMGPLRTADLVGLDVVLALLQSLVEQTGDARFAVPDVLVEMVASGKLGKKSGEGFYKYD